MRKLRFREVNQVHVLIIFLDTHCLESAATRHGHVASS